jgi:hypothetical protein
MAKAVEVRGRKMWSDWAGGVGVERWEIVGRGSGVGAEIGSGGVGMRKGRTLAMPGPGMASSGFEGGDSVKGW